MSSKCLVKVCLHVRSPILVDSVQIKPCNVVSDIKEKSALDLWRVCIISIILAHLLICLRSRPNMLNFNSRNALNSSETRVTVSFQLPLECNWVSSCSFEKGSYRLLWAAWMSASWDIDIRYENCEDSLKLKIFC